MIWKEIGMFLLFEELEKRLIGDVNKIHSFINSIHSFTSFT